MLNYIVLFVNWLIYPLEYRSCKSNFPTLDFERCDDFVTKSSLKSNKAEETKLDQSGTFFPTRTDDKICKAGKETVLDQFMEKEFGLFCSMILRVQMISILRCLKNALNVGQEAHNAREHACCLPPTLTDLRWNCARNTQQSWRNMFLSGGLMKNTTNLRAFNVNWC